MMHSDHRINERICGNLRHIARICGNLRHIARKAVRQIGKHSPLKIRPWALQFYVPFPYVVMPPGNPEPLKPVEPESTTNADLKP